MATLSRNEIAGLIPHAGTMCLLDEVEHWDASYIRCRTARHRCADNPLKRRDGSIGTVCALELAAQAMAVHGRLSSDASGPPKPGVIASVRDLRLQTTSLDQIADDLVIAARLLMGDGGSATYFFSVSASRREVASGRAMVIFDVEMS